MGGKGRAARVAVEDVNIGGTYFVRVVPTSGGGEGRCGCDWGTVLASEHMEVASQVRRIREEVMRVLSLLLAGRRLGTWEEGRRLENTQWKLERERVVAQKEHEVMKVAERVSAGAAQLVAKEREAVEEVEAAGKRQEAEGVARAEKLAALRKNLDVAAESVRWAKTDAEKSAGCEAVAVAHEEVKKAEAFNPSSKKVVAVGP